MYFDESRAYSAINAHYLDQGDVVVLASTLPVLRYRVCNGSPNVYTLESKPDTSGMNCFNGILPLAYLVAKRDDPLKSVKTACALGRVIQCRGKGTREHWRPLTNPSFDSPVLEYRAEPDKSKHRPFHSIDELLAHWYAITNLPERPYMMPMIWVNAGDSVTSFITGFDRADNTIRIGDGWYTMADAFDRFVFTDGSPFGVEEVDDD